MKSNSTVIRSSSFSPKAHGLAVGFQDNLIAGSSVLFVGSMIASVFSYLFQFFMSRRLSLVDFGAMNSLLSLMMISAVPTSALLLVTTKYVSRFKASNELELIRPFRNKVLVRVGASALAIAIPVAMISQFISSFLKIDSPIPVIIIIGTLYIGFLSPLNTGILQGLQRFFSLSMISVVTSLVRLSIGILLVSLGLKLNGAVLAFLISGFIFFFMPFYYARDLPKSDQKIDDLGIGKDKFIKSSVPIVFVSLSIMLLTNIDLVMVKHFFPKEDAGIYAAVSVLGRTVFYIPGSIVMAMFPIVSEGHAQRTDLIPILKKALLASFLIAGSATAVLLMYPETMLSFLFGSDFSEGSALLRPFTISMLFVALLNLLANFNLAIDNHRFLVIMLVGCLAEIILISLFHQTLLSVIIILLVVTFSVLSLVLYQTFWRGTQILH